MQADGGKWRDAHDIFDELRTRGGSWPPLRPDRLRRGRGSVGTASSAARFSNGTKMRRAIEIYLHRYFAVVVFWEDRQLRHRYLWRFALASAYIRRLHRRNHDNRHCIQAIHCEGGCGFVLLATRAVNPDNGRFEPTRHDREVDGGDGRGRLRENNHRSRSRGCPRWAVP